LDRSKVAGLQAAELPVCSVVGHDVTLKRDVKYQQKERQPHPDDRSSDFAFGAGSFYKAPQRGHFKRDEQQECCDDYQWMAERAWPHARKQKGRNEQKYWSESQAPGKCEF
jgi:hypothetical protein